MNNIIRQSIIAAALLFSVTAASARGTSYSYSRSYNTQIGITAGNEVAVGGTYKILDSNGRVVLQGRIKSRNTFYIPTGKLGNGTYTFSVDGFNLQQFSIND